MKTVAFIPIKTNNERLPGKNTKTFFDNTPLMHFIQRSLLNTCGIAEIYVFCSDERIRDYCLDGVHFMLRGKELDTAQTTPADIIRAFMAKVRSDIYIAAHATTPFVQSSAIEDCLHAILHNGYDSSFTANRIRKLLWNEKRQAYNFNPANVPRTQDLPPLFAEVGAAYVFRREVFETTGRRIGINPYICEVGDIEATDIDCYEDFEMADLIYKEIIAKRKHLPPRKSSRGFTLFFCVRTSYGEVRVA
ncbi:MAG: CMP-N-acetylneuraminic acid synthetase [Clostridium sp.]|jgi:CMP-N-acetylneuraminic acid synthetase|nr:CMP-N-acetylneuraminic acid synthetase [Clostridium sp.]